MLALEIKPRDAKESPDTLRAHGAMPAVFYGPKEGATAISIDAPKFERIWREAGETTVITLRGVGEEKDTLIHDVQFHPVTSVPIHADFYVLEKGKKIKINVPLVFTGLAPAEKAGHIVVKALHEIEIALPASATLLTHASEIVASVTEFKEEKIEAPAPAPAAEGAPIAGEIAADATQPESAAGEQKEKKEKKEKAG